MLTKTRTKVIGGLLVLACIPLLVGANCLFAPPGVDEGSTDPISASVLGVVVPAPANLNVSIFAGAANIFGGVRVVAVPVNQAYDKAITGVAPHRAIDIYSPVWTDGAVGGVRVYMQMVTTDALGEGQHTVSLYFSAWNDVGATANMWDATDTPAALPNGAGGSMDLSVIAGNITIGVDSIQFQDNLAAPLTQVNEVVADLAGPAVAPFNMGKPYIAYMRDAPLGRFYNLVGLEAAIANPDVTCVGCFSAQVPGQNFFHSAANYGFDVDGGPFAITGLGGVDGDANGEFQYILLNAAFGGAGARQVLLDPWNGGVTTPIGAGNLTPGSNTVHELAVACTFLTAP